MDIETLDNIQGEELRKKLKAIEDLKFSNLLITNKKNNSIYEWENEPDELEWIDSETFLTCRIVRNNQMGSLNGYVAVSLKEELSSDEVDSLIVHGKITYENFAPDKKICLFGFDCAHGFDIVPKIHQIMISSNNIDMVVNNLFGKEYAKEMTYKNIFFVIAECQQLARQLKKYEYKNIVDTGIINAKKLKQSS